MKIPHTDENLFTAGEIILSIADRGGEMQTSGGDTITLRDGVLQYYYGDCGIGDGETVLLSNVQPDSFGEGWELDQAAEFLDALETIDA